MKNILLIVFALVLATTFNSCKKCSNCVLDCRICTSSSLGSTTVCRDQNTSIDVMIASYVASGYNCNVTANDEQNICTSGLFYRLRHDSDVQSKEDAGYKCN